MAVSDRIAPVIGARYGFVAVRGLPKGLMSGGEQGSGAMVTVAVRMGGVIG